MFAKFLCFLYNCILIFLLPFVWFRLYFKSKKQREYWHHKAERFALKFNYFAKPLKTNEKLIWLHAVSVGEIRGCQSVIHKLLKDKKNKLLITMTTPTGREVVTNLWNKEIFKQRIIFNYLPYDVRLFQRRFLKFYQPKIVLLMETEIWLNLILECQHFKIPTILINARLSEKSKNNYQQNALFRKLAKLAFSNLSLVLAQSDNDAQRFLEIGVKSANLAICGNLKFDIEINKNLVDLGKQWRKFWQQSMLANANKRFILLAASTRDGEEQLLFEEWKNLLRKLAFVKAHNDNRALMLPLLIVVPRHPQRFAEIYKLAQQFNLNIVKRSEIFDNSTKNLSTQEIAEIDVLLGDSMGEMVAYYSCADIAIIGGSLLNFGGQNLIEAAACGCPTMFCQKNMFNFSVAAENAVKFRAAINIDTLSEISDFVVKNYVNPQLENYKNSALIFADSYKGATKKTMDLLKEKGFL